MRIRTNNGPFCSVITLTERKWATNWLSPEISGTPTSYVKADFGPTGEQLWLVPGSYRTLAESMTDDKGNDGRFRACHHTIETNEFTSGAIRTLYGECAQTNTFLKGVTVPIISSLISFSQPPNVDMVAMADEATAFMIPHVNEGDSLVNFLLELKDVKRSVSNAGIALSRVFGNPTNLKRFNPRKIESYSDLSFKLRSGRGKMLKDITKRLAGAHLEGSYGIQLTVADIVSFYTSLEDLEYKFKVLKQYANRSQVRHYRRYIPASAGVPTNREWRYQTASTTGWPANCTFDSSPSPRASVTTRKRTRWILRPVYHATMRYSYSLPLLEEAQAKLDAHFAAIRNLPSNGIDRAESNASEQRRLNGDMYALARLDALGVRVDPGIVWDAIPLSFIVDWVVDVSSFLHSFARSNFPIETKITDFCHSLAYSYEAEISQTFLANTTVNYVPPPLWWTDAKDRFRNPGSVYRRTYSAYDRSLIKPDAHAVAVKSLKLRQAAIAGSLLITRTLTARR